MRFTTADVAVAVVVVAVAVAVVVVRLLWRFGNEP